jgi:hypothetical protein
MRQEQTAAGDEVHAVQGRFYEANAEVSRLEAEIRFVVDAQSQLQARRESLGTQSDRWAAERDDARQGVFQAEDGLTDATLRAETLAERVTMLADELPEVESRVRGMREQVDSARSEALATRQQIELSAVRRRTAEQARVEAERRQDRLEAESAQVDAPDDAAAEAMALSLEAAEVAEQSTAESLAAADDAWRDADGRRAPAQQALREAEGRLAQIEARIAALRQLQERVQSQGRINPWLERHGLERLSRLWQRLRIEHGWETAVEALLRERIGALQVERLDSLAGLAGDAPPAKVTFFSPGVVPTFTTEAIEGLQPLSARIQCNDAALQAMPTEWLRGAWAAGSIDEAVARRGQLPPGACFVTEAGHLVDRHSIRLYAADSEQDGVLARHFEIDNLEREVRAQRLLADGARDAAVRIEAAAGERRQQLAQARESHSQAVRRLSDVRLQAQQLEQARARAQSTRSRVAAELAEVGEAMARAQAVIDEEADRLRAARCRAGRPPATRRRPCRGILAGGGRPVGSPRRAAPGRARTCAGAIRCARVPGQDRAADATGKLGPGLDRRGRIRIGGGGRTAGSAVGRIRPRRASGGARGPRSGRAGAGRGALPHGRSRNVGARARRSQAGGGTRTRTLAAASRGTAAQGAGGTAQRRPVRPAVARIQRRRNGNRRCLRRVRAPRDVAGRRSHPAGQRRGGLGAGQSRRPGRAGPGQPNARPSSTRSWPTCPPRSEPSRMRSARSTARRASCSRTPTIRSIATSDCCSPNSSVEGRRA